MEVLMADEGEYFWRRMFGKIIFISDKNVFMHIPDRPEIIFIPVGQYGFRYSSDKKNSQMLKEFCSEILDQIPVFIADEFK